MIVGDPRLPRLLGNGRAWFLLSLVTCGVAQAGAAAVAVWMTRLSIDSLGEGAPVWPTAAALAVSGLVLSGLRVSERGIAEALGQRYAADLRSSLLRSVMATSATALVDKRKGALMLRFVGDLSAVRAWVSRGVGRLIVAGITLPLLIVALCFIHPILGTAVGAVMAAGLAGTLALGPRLGDLHRSARSARGILSTRLAERMGDPLALRFSCDPAREAVRLERLSSRVREESVRRASGSALVRGLPDAAGGLALALVVGIGAHLSAADRLSIGSIVAAVAMVSLLVRPLRDLAGVQDHWRAYLAARERLVTLMIAEQPLRPAAPTLVAGPAAVACERLQVLADSAPLDGTGGPGAMVKVAGASGSGKSLLLLIAGGMAAPAHGRLLVDGTSAGDWASSDLALAVGFVSPELNVMKGQVRDLLRARAPKASTDAMNAALARSGSLNDLTPLGGLRAKVAEGGRNLPLSVRLRLSLAIALVGRPRLLLVDEADLLGASGLSALAAVGASREMTLLFTERGAILPWDSTWKLVPAAENAGTRTLLQVVA